jgi:outer membrane receptor protein involved in Fe transport
MTISTPKIMRAVLTALVCVLGFLATNAACADETKKTFDIPAGDALPALKQFAAQSGEQLLYSADAVQGVATNPAKGLFTAREALDEMVKGTKLTVVADKKNGALSLVRAADPKGPRAAQPESDRPEKANVVEGKLVLDKFEVMGSKLLNMDKPRSRDDAQPYVVFDRSVIENSGATNIEDLLKNRLPQETTVRTESTFTTSSFGARSSINLRGLGTNQTLILVDGHRLSGANATVSDPAQPDLNGIPLSAVERIEILPATASGIYGGGATGGVVNVILRRDYAGVEVKLTYSNAFDTDVGQRRVDFNAGLTLEGGKTNVLLAASYSDGHSLLAQDRQFDERNWNTIWSRNPLFFLTRPMPDATTTNVRSSNGANLVLKPVYGGVSLNSPFTFVPTGYAGPASDNAAGLISNAGKLNLESSTAYTGRGSRYRALNSTPTVKSLSATIRRQFNANFQAFIDVGASENNAYAQYTGGGALSIFNLSAASPGNPFNQTVTVVVPQYFVPGDTRTKSEDRRAVAGLIVKLPADWQAGADYSFSQSTVSQTRPTPASSYSAAVTSGALNAFSDLKAYPFNFSPYYSGVIRSEQDPLKTAMSDGVIRASGPVWHLPGGRPTLSTLIEHREEVAHESHTGDRFQPERTQKVGSAYAEFNVPLIGEGNRLPLVRGLELQLAVRRDEYTTDTTNTIPLGQTLYRASNKLNSTDPTIGLRWEVTPDVVVRASYGTGFLPPSITQLVSDPDTAKGFLGFEGLTDPKRGGEEITSGDEIWGGNPNLKPERSKTWSGGLVLTPRGISGLRVSADYIKLEKRDNITFNSFAAYMVANEGLFPGRVLRGPKLPGDPASWAGPISSVDVSLINIAQANLEAVDLTLDYHKETATFGIFDFFASATRTLHYQTQLLPISPVVENVGRSSASQAAVVSGAPNYPLNFKANFGLTWKYHRWTAGWTTRYFAAYRIDPANSSAIILSVQGDNGLIPSQTFHDLFVRYQFGLQTSPGSGSKLAMIRSRVTDRLELQVGVNNIFNKWPVFDASSLYNGYGDPRLSNYYVSLKKAF